MQAQEPSVSPIRPIVLKEQNSRHGLSSPQAKVLRRQLYVSVAVALVVGVGIGYLYKKSKDDAKQVIVAVNGKVISAPRFFNALQLVAGPPTIQKLVNDEVQMQFAQQRGLVPSSAQIAARYKELQNQPNFDLILKSSGMTAPQYKEGLKLLMAQQAVYSQGMTVTDADVQKYYEDESLPGDPKALFYRPPVTTLQAIATASYADAETAVNQIVNGSPFEVVAGQLSLDSSKGNGGRLNPIMYGRSVLTNMPSVERKVFALRGGQLSDPIFFSGQWWVFKCDQYAPPVQIPLPQVIVEARADVLATKGLEANGAQIKQEFANFLKSSNIQAFWPQYAQAAGANQN